MKKAPLIFGFLAFLVVSAAVAKPILTRMRENQRRFGSISAPSGQRSASIGTPDYQSKEWQARAKTFDRNKLSASAIFSGATRVEVFRLFSNSAEKQGGKINVFPYFSKTVADLGVAPRLADIVLDAKSYAFPGRSIKQCYFEPGVNIRVWNQKKFVDTIVCLECNQLAVLENDPKVPENNMGGSLQGRFFVAGDFDSVRPQLLALVKSAFANDTQIEALN